MLQLGTKQSVPGRSTMQTHQCFPLHAYPSDYFRFSRNALASLFGTDMGMAIVATEYDYPAQIYSRRLSDSHRHLAFLNTLLWAEKRVPTPADYRYEL